AKIEELLPFVEQYGQAHDALTALDAKFPEAMKKSVLQYAMEGKLVEQNPEEGTASELLRIMDKYNSNLSPCKSELDFSAMEYKLPASWEFVELNRVLRFVDYRGKTPHKSDKGIFLVTASNIKKGYMDYTRKEYISIGEYQTRLERGITEKGDLLFTTEAPMGNCALCDLEECSCGQRIITFKEYHKNTVNLSLMMYFILSPQFQQQLLDNCTGTTAKGIKAEKLKHFRIPLPPLAEQRRIVAKIEELLACCEPWGKEAGA
ncbi:MAG: restriction endonuclease subunit S, partial [Schwartzia sp.]|nr:restriction endonuclease subunit S [Schwartzia sp. (in: firmicutes)]